MLIHLNMSVHMYIAAAMEVHNIEHISAVKSKEQHAPESKLLRFHT